MAAFDYNALRTQTLHSREEEEAVTVNTRALVRLPISVHLLVVANIAWF